MRQPVPHLTLIAKSAAIFVLALIGGAGHGRAANVDFVREVRPNPDTPGATVTTLVRTSANSWAEPDVAGVFDRHQASREKDDLSGPISIATAYERKTPAEAKKDEAGAEKAEKKDGEAAPELAKAKQASQVYASVGFGASSRALAGHVQGSLVRGISAKNPKAARDRGIKHASFAVLRGARMPSVLVEVSFVSNPEDENRLRTPAFRQRIASSLTAGVRSYVRTVGSS